MDKETSNQLYDEVTRLSEDEEYFGLYTKLSHHEMLENTIKKEAREAGLKEGIKQKAIDIAKKMLTMSGITLEQIKEATGLTLTEIEKLK